MRVVTAAEMRAIDRSAMEKYHLPGIILMEHAALAVANLLKEDYPQEPVGIICGQGNNGGDGWALARLLYQSGRRVTVFHSGVDQDLPPDARVNMEVTRSLGISTLRWGELLADPKRLQEYRLVVDALLGTGFHGVADGAYARMISLVNDSGLPVISIDIPSGVEADTGKVAGPAIRATATVTFGLPKVGLLVYPGRELAGAVKVDPIGIPSSLLTEGAACYYTLTSAEVESLLPRRGPLTHKGDQGRLLVVGGSPGMTGAPVLAGLAALRSGAGLVTLGVRDHLTLPEKPPELMTKGWTSLNWTDYDAVVIGPGLSQEPDGREILATALSQSDIPVVVDADALNLLATEESWWRWVKGPLILTPHPGEMARICGLNVKEVQRSRLDLAREKAGLWGAVVVLKGAATLVAEEDEPIYINHTGNPGMATGGTGDLLAGMIGGLLVQGLAAPTAATLGVYLHGEAGDQAAKEKGYAGMIASDLLSRLPEVFHYYEKRSSGSRGGSLFPPDTSMHI